MMQDPSLIRRFSEDRIHQRDYDELVGMCKGIIADGGVNQKEAEFLLNWIQAHPDAATLFPANLLADRLLAMLVDKSLDREEAEELLAFLSEMTGEKGQQAKGSMPTSLAFDAPMPPLLFARKTFILTGTFQSGLRRDIEQKLTELGATVGNNVVKTPCCLVVGSLVTESWIHSTHGRKLEKAIAYKAQGCQVAIVSEDHLWNEIERLGSAAIPLPEQREDPGAYWRDLLSVWFAPLALAPEQYEVTVTKAMVAAHLPGKPKSRICAIRYGGGYDSNFIATSIDVPGQGTTKIDGSAMDRNGDVIDSVRTRNLPAETLEMLQSRLNALFVSQ
ncbi:MAG: BRCT domain-containing protein [Desulfovibrio sp.]|jgi:hypothetical protein|nr:BRCT domain-containing protein [Desulfovibrio sp.]